MRQERDLRWAVGEPTGDGPIKLPCPNAVDHEGGDDSSPSYCVWATGPTRCFGCGFSETPEGFLSRLGVALDDLPPVGTRGTKPRSAQERYHDYQSTRLAPHVLRGWVRACHRILTEGSRRHRLSYLHDRGIRKRTIEDELIGHTGERFVLPIWDFTKRQVLGVKLRSDYTYLDPDFRKYDMPRGQPPLLYRPNFRGSPTIITEGEFDALILSQYGIDAVTSTAGADSLAKVVRPDTVRRKVVLAAIDHDGAGDKAYGALAQTFGTLPRLELPAGDVTDALLAVPVTHRQDAIDEWITRALRHDAVDEKGS